MQLLRVGMVRVMTRARFGGTFIANVNTTHFKSTGVGVTVTPALSGNYIIEADVLIYSDNANQYVSAQLYQIASGTIPVAGTDVTGTSPASGPTGDAPQNYLESITASKGQELHLQTYSTGFTIGVQLSFYIATSNLTLASNNVVIAQPTVITAWEI